MDPMGYKQPKQICKNFAFSQPKQLLSLSVGHLHRWAAFDLSDAGAGDVRHLFAVPLLKRGAHRWFPKVWLAQNHWVFPLKTARWFWGTLVLGTLHAVFFLEKFEPKFAV